MSRRPDIRQDAVTPSPRGELPAAGTRSCGKGCMGAAASMVRFDRSMLRMSSVREEVLRVMEGALGAVSPARLVRALVSREGDVLTVGTSSYFLRGRRVIVLGAGKASACIARELETILGDVLTEGIVVTRYGYATSTERIRIAEGGHPLPDEDGVVGAAAIAALAQTAREGDLVLCAFSGGASALLSLPSPDIGLADLRALYGLLLGSGAPIDAVNVVRRHVTPLLGGGLARRLAGAQVVTLLLSDVVGDSVEVIASGPTAPDPSRFDDAKDVLTRFHLWERTPDSIRDRIDRGLRGRVPETAKPGDPAFRLADTYILGNNRTAVAGALEEGEKSGLQVQVLDQPIVGEARVVGRRLARMALDAGNASRRVVLVGGGETTVAVRGAGHGGRNQEVALAAALELEGQSDVTIAALATDGTDGPTHACGGIVDGETCARARTAGLDPEGALSRNDAYSLLSATRDLLFTGPTRTNVADVFVLRVGPASVAA